MEEQSVDAPAPEHVMVVVQVNPEAASAAAAEAECAALRAFLQQRSGDESQTPPLSVLLLQHHSGESSLV